MTIYQDAKQLKSDLIHDLEFNLDQIMAPIRPNPDFILALRKRLTSKPHVTVEQIPKYQALLLIPAGLFLAAFLVWILRRNR